MIKNIYLDISFDKLSEHDYQMRVSYYYTPEGLHCKYTAEEISRETSPSSSAIKRLTSTMEENLDHYHLNKYTYFATDRLNRVLKYNEEDEPYDYNNRHDGVLFDSAFHHLNNSGFYYNIEVFYDDIQYDLLRLLGVVKEITLTDVDGSIYTIDEPNKVYYYIRKCKDNCLNYIRRYFEKNEEQKWVMNPTSLDDYIKNLEIIEMMRPYERRVEYFKGLPLDIRSSFDSISKILSRVTFDVHDIYVNVDKSLQTSREFIQELLKYDGNFQLILADIPDDDLKKDPEMIKMFIDREPFLTIKSILGKYKVSEELLLYALEREEANFRIFNGHMRPFITVMRIVPDSYKRNANFMVKAIAISEFNYDFASDDLKNNREIGLTLAKKNGMYFYKWADRSLFNDPEIMWEVIKTTGAGCLVKSTTLLKNKEFMIKVIASCRTISDLASVQNLMDRSLLLDQDVFAVIQQAYFHVVEVQKKVDEIQRSGMSVDSDLLTLISDEVKKGR